MQFVGTGKWIRSWIALKYINMDCSEFRWVDPNKGRIQWQTKWWDHKSKSCSIYVRKFAFHPLMYCIVCRNSVTDDMMIHSWLQLLSVPHNIPLHPHMRVLQQQDGMMNRKGGWRGVLGGYFHCSPVYVKQFVWFTYCLCMQRRRNQQQQQHKKASSFPTKATLVLLCVCGSPRPPPSDAIVLP